MTYDVISTGSKGNAVVINGRVLIDIGVPFKMLRDVKKDLAVVLLTHIHGDHFNPRTVRALSKERPTLRWGCCEWMVGPLLEAGVDERRIDVMEPGVWYNHPSLWLSVSPVSLTHDVPNCGYRICMEEERLFYATDTGTLDGIQAKDYDLYLIEANHTREELEARLKAKQEAGEYAYEVKAAENHLSLEQAQNWIYENIGPRGQYAFLHQHSGGDWPC